MKIEFEIGDVILVHNDDDTIDSFVVEHKSRWTLECSPRNDDRTVALISVPKDMAVPAAITINKAKRS